MGSSGAGKTTLLVRLSSARPDRCVLTYSHTQDVLANRKTIGVIEGSVLIDGRKTGRDFQRGTAYVEQMVSLHRGRIYAFRKLTILSRRILMSTLPPFAKLSDSAPTFVSQLESRGPRRIAT